jgi:outer membrane lipoprotein SlyB
MNYKKLFVFIFILLSCTALFAGGTAEAMFSGAAAGATAGSFLGVPGSLVGAGLGFLFGGLSGSRKETEANKQKGLTYESKYLEAKAASEAYDSKIKQDEIALTSAHRKVTAYDEFISNFGDNRLQQEQALQAQGNQQQEQLMSNFSNIQTVIGATGQTGASAAIAGDVAKQGVEDFAGEDLTLNRTGSGTFAKIWDDTERELTDKYSSSQLSKQDLFSVMENYRSSISKNTKSRNTQVETANEFKEEANKYGRKIN